VAEPLATIDDYLARLRRRVPSADDWWQRALLEIEDHLRCGAAAASAEDPAGTESTAIDRFGSIESISQALAIECAISLTRRAGVLLGALLLVIVALSGLTQNGPFLTGHVGAPAVALAEFLITQVAYAAAALCLLQLGWIGLRGQPSAPIIRSALNGGLVALTTLSVGLLLKLLTALAGSSGGLLPTGALVMFVTVACAGFGLASLGWRLRRTVGALGSAESSLATNDTPFPLISLQPSVLLALAILFGGVFAFKVGSMPDGLWPSLATQGAWEATVAGASCALVEVVVILVAYHALGPHLGLCPEPDSRVRAP
jgi:hypothetical protein